MKSNISDADLAKYVKNNGDQWSEIRKTVQAIGVEEMPVPLDALVQIKQMLSQITTKSVHVNNAIQLMQTLTTNRPLVKNSNANTTVVLTKEEINQLVDDLAAIGAELPKQS